jgi:hypothetical protein
MKTRRDIGDQWRNQVGGLAAEPPNRNIKKHRFFKENTILKDLLDLRRAVFTYKLDKL